MSKIDFPHFLKNWMVGQKHFFQIRVLHTLFDIKMTYEVCTTIRKKFEILISRFQRQNLFDFRMFAKCSWNFLNQILLQTTQNIHQILLNIKFKRGTLRFILSIGLVQVWTKFLFFQTLPSNCATGLKSCAPVTFFLKVGTLFGLKQKFQVFWSTFVKKSFVIIKWAK